MTKTTKHKTSTKQKQDEIAAAILPALLTGAIPATIKTALIDFSPLNYRKYFSDEALTLFAAELKQHGIISPLTVRKAEGECYELVAGERRLRAARMAGIEDVPVMIADLTDEQVREIQLSENIQRENPHPMDEARGILQMQKASMSIEEIATRLGRSPKYVFSRLRLKELIEPFQEMLYENKFSLQDAFKIAGLSPQSQTDFFEAQCSNWKKKKDFSLYNLDYYLNRYRYDLKRAPFNTKDKQLLPDVGACTGCPSNSSSLKNLFPELAKEATCSNRECYQSKCNAHFVFAISNAIATYQPIAIISRSEISEHERQLLALIPGASELPRHYFYDITVIEKPEEPEQENYEDEEGEPDTEAFKEAQEEYESELEAYNLRTKNGQYKIGLLMESSGVAPVYFSMEKPKPQSGNGATVTAKDVQAAIKAGRVTPALLKAEIERLNMREKRLEQLDREKVQLAVHTQFTEWAMTAANHNSPTTADMAAMRLIVYQSLGYHARQAIREILMKTKGRGKDHDDSQELLFKRLCSLTPKENAYLLRMALCGNSESKYPSQSAGYFLYKVAEAAKQPVKTIEQEQAAKEKQRKEKLKTRIKELEQKLKKLKPAA